MKAPQIPHNGLSNLEQKVKERIMGGTKVPCLAFQPGDGGGRRRGGGDCGHTRGESWVTSRHCELHESS